MDCKGLFTLSSSSALLTVFGLVFVVDLERLLLLNLWLAFSAAAVEMVFVPLLLRTRRGGELGGRVQGLI